MRMNHKMVLCLLLFFAACIKHDNLVDSSPFNRDGPGIKEGNGKLSINTEKAIYSWQIGESRDYIIIQASLQNESKTIFYSCIGDGFGPSEQEQFYIAAGSDGYIEKFSESANSWIEKDLSSLLIEGSKVVPIKPSRAYSITAHLSKDREEHETGSYRIRIDYYDVVNADSGKIAFRDYSDVFAIK